jgi:hypothetical protein
MKSVLFPQLWNNGILERWNDGMMVFKGFYPFKSYYHNEFYRLLNLLIPLRIRSSKS